jgi:hypothetical protein
MRGAEMYRDFVLESEDFCISSFFEGGLLCVKN